MVLAQIEKITFQKLHVVLGMVNDKEIDKILSLFPTHANYFFCQAKIPRALDKHELKAKAAHFGLTGNVYASVKAALNAANKIAHKEDLIFVGGSTFVVAEVV